MQQEVSHQVTKILESLDQVKRASAPAFFYTRLRARMEAPLPTSTTFLLRPAFTLLVMLLLLMVNSFLVVNRTSPQPSVAEVTDKEDTLHWTNEYAANDLYPVNDAYADWASTKH